MKYFTCFCSGVEFPYKKDGVLFHEKRLLSKHVNYVNITYVVSMQLHMHLHHRPCFQTSTQVLFLLKFPQLSLIVCTKNKEQLQQILQYNHNPNKGYILSSSSSYHICYNFTVCPWIRYNQNTNNTKHVSTGVRIQI